MLQRVDLGVSMTFFSKSCRSHGHNAPPPGAQFWLYGHTNKVEVFLPGKAYFNIYTGGEFAAPSPSAFSRMLENAFLENRMSISFLFDNSLERKNCNPPPLNMKNLKKNLSKTFVVKKMNGSCNVSYIAKGQFVLLRCEDCVKSLILIFRLYNTGVQRLFIA